MLVNPNKYNRSISLPFWWLLLTVIYIVPFIVFSVKLNEIGIFLSFIGMFVPIGITSAWNIIYFEGSILIVLFVLIPLIFFGDRIAHLLKVPNSTLPKIVFNLFYLAAVTLIIDALVYGKWVSLLMLIGEN